MCRYSFNLFNRKVFKGLFLYTDMVKTFKLYWKGEQIDEAEDRSEAEYLKKEYNLAFKGGVSIK